MASSSLSQESLDREQDHSDAYSSRRGRIRSCRAVRCASNQGTEEDGQGAHPSTSTLVSEHDSPSRGAAAVRTKEKKGRPNHFPKGKTAKDKRKLREKRRSTGVVHMPSTESTGDSLDDDDDHTGQTRRNTSHNEVIDADNPQTPEEDKVPLGYNTGNMRSKSPSDLEADFEDNQDYDSTVSQSESNLTLVGQASPQTAYVPKVTRIPVEGRGHTSPDLTHPSLTHKDDFSRPLSYPSHYHDLEGKCSGGLAGLRLKDHRRHHHHHDMDIQQRQGHLKQDHLITQESKASLVTKIKELEKTLKKEQESNVQLKNLLEEKDLIIIQLEKEIHLLHQDLETVDEENEKLQLENRALLQAMKGLRI